MKRLQHALQLTRPDAVVVPVWFWGDDLTSLAWQIMPTIRSVTWQIMPTIRSVRWHPDLGAKHSHLGAQHSHLDRHSSHAVPSR